MIYFVKKKFPLLVFVGLIFLGASRSEGADASHSKAAACQQEKKPFPSWIQRGAEGYGIVFFTFPDGTTLGQSVKVRVLLMSDDKVRLRAMESISLSRREGCGALGVNFGDTWWEEDLGDLFKTREEADKFLKEKGWLK